MVYTNREDERKLGNGRIILKKIEDLSIVSLTDDLSYIDKAMNKIEELVKEYRKLGDK